MAQPIPFVREIDIDYGRCDTVSPLIRRVTANNPSAFSYLGTGTYIVGKGTVAVIDPGPLLTDHLEALLAAIEGETVSHILVTHDHSDHSPLAVPFSEKTGAKVYGYAPEVVEDGLSEIQMDAGRDTTYKPDVIVADGDLFEGPGWTLQAIHTPGHTSNHMCYALREENALFSGDHIMGWSTTVVVPPDGNMTQYMKSVEKLIPLSFNTLWPTHGPPVTEVTPFLQAYIDHRLAREEQILSCLKDNIGAVADMVARMYADVDKKLHPAAAQSVRAHLGKLLDEGKIVGADGNYRLS